MKFTSSSLYGITEYEIQGGVLVIRRRRSVADFQTRVALAKLNSEYESLWVIRPFIWIGSTLSLIGAIGSIVVGESPQISNWWFWVWAFVILTVMGGTLILFSLRRIHLVRFLYLGGSAAVDIIDDRSPTGRFDSFVAAVQAGIRAEASNDQTG
jgi:hypothetical protein